MYNRQLRMVFLTRTVGKTVTIVFGSGYYFLSIVILIHLQITFLSIHPFTNLMTFLPRHQVLPLRPLILYEPSHTHCSYLYINITQYTTKQVRHNKTNNAIIFLLTMSQFLTFQRKSFFMIIIILHNHSTSFDG